MKKNFYGIKKGLKSNIVVKTWDECSRLVTGCPGAIFKGFVTEAEAVKFSASGNYGKYTPKEKPKVKDEIKKAWGKCLERKSYKDLITGVFYKNRCVLKYVATTTGINYRSVDTVSAVAPWV
jgi:viroplasmin and RNaseH domain-containing protein